MPSRKQTMQSGKIRERLRALFIGESLSKLRTAYKSLQNQFRPRKLAKVLLYRMQRAKAKTQAAKVLRKELAKEESSSPVEQILDRF